MKTDELKTGFWGYKKFSVYQYINSLEEQFSAQLLEKDRESRAALEQAQQRVRQLEQEVADLRRQLESRQNEQMLISSTLMEAQRYAEQLKQESNAREQEAQRQMEEALKLRDQILARYDSQISHLRQQFASVLQEMEASARQVSLEVEDLKAAAPDRNMSLFRRNPEPKAEEQRSET